MGQLLNGLNGAIARMRYGEMHRFTFHKGTGISGMDIERILQNYGIQIWAREMNEGDEGGFIVKQAQAEWAERVMWLNAFPVIFGAIVVVVLLLSWGGVL